MHTIYLFYLTWQYKKWMKNFLFWHLCTNEFQHAVPLHFYQLEEYYSIQTFNFYVMTWNLLKITAISQSNRFPDVDKKCEKWQKFLLMINHFRPRILNFRNLRILEYYDEYPAYPAVAPPAKIYATSAFQRPVIRQNIFFIIHFLTASHHRETAWSRVMLRCQPSCIVICR